MSFVDGNLIMTLPSGRAITYPEARLVPGKFEDGPSDVEFYDNARGQWRRTRAWFGTFVENCVQGCARDLLAAAIERFETRNIAVVFHCHDEVTVEVPVGSLSEQEFREILLKLPAWAHGIPLGGKVHVGPHYLEEPEQPAEPLVEPNPTTSRSTRRSIATSRILVTTSVQSTTRPWSSARTTRTSSLT